MCADLFPDCVSDRLLAGPCLPRRSDSAIGRTGNPKQGPRRIDHSKIGKTVNNRVRLAPLSCHTCERCPSSCDRLSSSFRACAPPLQASIEKSFSRKAMLISRNSKIWFPSATIFFTCAVLLSHENTKIVHELCTDKNPTAARHVQRRRDSALGLLQPSQLVLRHRSYFTVPIRRLRIATATHHRRVGEQDCASTSFSNLPQSRRLCARSP